MTNLVFLASLSLGISAVVPARVVAEGVADHPRGLRVGERAPVSGVYFACGAWAAEHQKTCPAARRGNDPKIAIYTTTLDENVLNLALAVDRLIAGDATLKWSFVSVSDQKGGNVGVKSADYYSKAELAQRLAELKTSAVHKGIQQLTLGITSTGDSREREKLGIPEDANVLVTFLDGDRRRSRLVKFVKPIHSSNLDAETIASLLEEIKVVRYQ